LKVGRFLARTTKGLYDILASYLLAWTLLLALLALALHGLLLGLARLLGLDGPAEVWASAATRLGMPPLHLRLGLLVGLHVVLLALLRRPLGWLAARLEGAFDRGAGVWQRLSQRWPRLQAVAGVGFTLVVSALLVPFVVQPTLVAHRFDRRTWLERAANLLDGRATVEVVDSVVGLYRHLYARPVVGRGVSADDFDRATRAAQAADAEGEPPDGPSQPPAVGRLDGPGPEPEPQPEPGTPPLPPGQAGQRTALARTGWALLDRWDPLIARAAAGDRRQAAFIKAFMWVESGGRQFAVSSTGCAGLMQFCPGTARTAPFRGIFGRGQIYPCGSGSGMSREMQRELESGRPEALGRHAAAFPCDYTDARFDAWKSIQAGSAYITLLRRTFGDNLELMYVGYNSGPRVAQGVFQHLGRDRQATQDRTRSAMVEKLAPAMRPYFGPASLTRARSLQSIHLPKLRRMLDRLERSTAQAAL
jgi:hypothetical protein